MKSIRTILLLLLLQLSLASAWGQNLKFAVQYPVDAFAGPFSGRVIVCLTTGSGQPRFGPNWFRPEPMYSKIVKNVKPGEAILIDDTAIGSPSKLSALKAGEYTVQAVLDRNLGGRRFGDSPGNLYSETKRVTYDPGTAQTVEIVCNQVAKDRPFQETETVKEVRVESKLLSRFYGRPTFLSAAVALPAEYATQPERRFPILYAVPGFGGTHFGLSGRSNLPQTQQASEPFLYVVLNPDCPTGHSVFADSDNNGPWGKALTTELIPEIEKRFRAVGKTEARFVTGHSSGGWSSLWLQVTYPDVFGGCWSTSPDPVDFRDFQQIDLYAPKANMFVDSGGQERPIARRGDTATLFYRGFSDMERPIRGEQLGSFEGVFSPRGKDGEPMLLWNRETGAIDSRVAAAWRRYDIGYQLRTHWKEWEPKLKSKIHVYMGDKDTFYLEGAVKLLQADMQRLGADAKIELFPGDHGSVMTPALRERIAREIAAQFRKK